MKATTSRFVGLVTMGGILGLLIVVLLCVSEIFWTGLGLVSGIYFGFAATSLIWISAFYLSHVLLHPDDAYLSRYSPLTPAILYRNTFMRFMPLLAVGYACATILYLLVLSSGHRWGVVRPRFVHFSLNLVCVVWLTFFVTLRERLSGRRPWTLLVFLLRIPFRAFGMYSPSVGILGLATVWWWGPKVAPYVTECIRALLSWPIGGPIVIFLLSPMSGVLAIHTADPRGPLPWALTAFCLITIIDCARVLRHAWRKPILEIDQEQFETWTEWRTTLEEMDEDVTAEDDARQRVRIPRDTLGVDAGEEASQTEDLSPVLPYDSSLEPEKQVIRYHVAARVEPLRLSETRSVVRYVFAHFWLFVTLVGWGFYFQWGTGDAHGLFLVAFSLLGLGVLGMVGRTASVSWCRSSAIPLPLRWPRLFRAAWRASRAYILLADLSGALCIAACTRSGLAGFVMLFTTFLVLRAALALSLWVTKVSQVGRGIADRIILFLWAPFFMIALVLWVMASSSARTGTPVQSIPVILATLAGSLQVLGLNAILVAFTKRKAGNAVYGPEALGRSYPFAVRSQ